MLKCTHAQAVFIPQSRIFDDYSRTVARTDDIPAAAHVVDPGTCVHMNVRYMNVRLCMHPWHTYTYTDMSGSLTPFLLHHLSRKVCAYKSCQYTWSASLCLSLSVSVCLCLPPVVCTRGQYIQDTCLTRGSHH
jgi:hypothetical protein